MALPIAAILGILEDNLRLRGSVMPLSRKRQVGWAKGLSLPRGGSRILYTGHMYQMMPAIADLATWLGRFENTPITKLMGLGRLANQWINLSAFMTFPSRAMQTLYDRRLRSIAQLLQRAQVSFGYLYEQELYAGALVYDLGGDQVFRKHAAKVWQRLQALGVTSVITLDPHTTEMLREVYPKVVPGYQLEVKSYLEVLAESGWTPNPALPREVVLHDSCVYARGLGIIEPARTLLTRAQITQYLPEYSGQGTHCCGGPAESLFPRKAEVLAEARVQQLAASGGKIIAAMCPICQYNLEKAGKHADMRVEDLAETLL